MQIKKITPTNNTSSRPHRDLKSPSIHITYGFGAVIKTKGNEINKNTILRIMTTTKKNQDTNVYLHSRDRALALTSDLSLHHVDVPATQTKYMASIKFWSGTRHTETKKKIKEMFKRHNRKQKGRQKKGTGGKRKIEETYPK